MTLAITILISAVVSLTLVPMLCAKILRHRSRSAESGFIGGRAPGSTASSPSMAACSTGFSITSL